VGTTSIAPPTSGAGTTFSERSNRYAFHIGRLTGR
jgi:hypothetical protein